MASRILWQIRAPAESPLTHNKQQRAGFSSWQQYLPLSNPWNVDTWVCLWTFCMGTVWPVSEVGGGEALLFRDDQVKHANVLYERKVSLLPARSVEASSADCLPMLKASWSNRCSHAWQWRSRRDSHHGGGDWMGVSQCSFFGWKSIKD